MNQEKQNEEKEWNQVKQKISSKLWKLKKLFMKSSENQTLSEHKSWNHVIELKEEATTHKLPIYSSSLEELKELQKYIDRNLWKRYIRKSISKAEYSVIFVLKKDKDEKWTRK